MIAVINVFIYGYIPGDPKKNRHQLNGSITVIFQLISIKLAELVVQPMCDTHTKIQVDSLTRTDITRF